MNASTRRPRLRPVAYPVAFAAGAVLGTFWDRLHVASGALSYADYGIAGQPWWIPLEFGAAFAAGVAVFTLLGDPAPRPASPRIAAIEVLWLTAIYATTAFFDQMPWMLAVVLLAALAVRARDLAPIAAGSPIPVAMLIVGGPLFEAMLITAGVDVYRTSQIGPLPVWLPLLWMNGVLLMARFSEALLWRFGVRRITEPATAVVTATDPPPEPEPVAEEEL